MKIKKLLPILTIIGASTLIVGCSNNITVVKALNETKEDCINCEENNLEKNTDINTTILDKYKVDVNVPKTLELTEDNLVEENKKDDQVENNDDSSEFSTLYSLSNDLEKECDDFCELKEEITDAIIETQNLIKKLEDNSLELTTEQRHYVNEQAMQLKNLTRQLSGVTTELSFNLSDLKQILNDNKTDVNSLSLKYLIVLDNLVNNNELLQSNLNSINMVNRMLYNTPNRLILGYQKNNEQPVVKDYTRNENGELVENSLENENNDTNSDNNSIVDTYNNNKLQTNIDSYYSNTPRNIDTFFNTALFNNEFMYGNGAMNGFGYGFNPYMNNYAVNNQINPNNNQINNNDTQQVDKDNEKVGNKERKKFKLKKNVDTYKNENTPDLKTRLKNFKEKLSLSLNKIQPKDNIKNPVFRF